jgi:hypothetical protein
MGATAATPEDRFDDAAHHGVALFAVALEDAACVAVVVLGVVVDDDGSGPRGRHGSVAHHEVARVHQAHLHHPEEQEEEGDEREQELHVHRAAAVADQRP